MIELNKPWMPGTNGRGVRDRRVHLADRQRRILPLDRLREVHFLVATPLRPRPLLLVNRDAFGQPPRDPLFRQLQRHHVRQLVPQGRSPVEHARLTRVRRIDRHDAAEAGAKRAQQAGQPEVADGEVVVVGEDLDEDWTGRIDAVESRQLRQSLRRQRHHVRPQHRRLGGIETDGQLPRLDRGELVERVEQRQEIERDDVVAVQLERRIERLAGRGFIAGTKQVHAEIRLGTSVRGVRRDRLPREVDRVVEPIAPGEQGGRHPIDLAVCRVDGVDVFELGLEVVGPPVYVGIGRQQAMRRQARRVQFQRARDFPARGGRLPLLEQEIGEENMC